MRVVQQYRIILKVSWCTASGTVSCTTPDTENRISWLHSASNQVEHPVPRSHQAQAAGCAAWLCSQLWIQFCSRLHSRRCGVAHQGPPAPDVDSLGRPWRGTALPRSPLVVVIGDGRTYFFAVAELQFILLSYLYAILFPGRIEITIHERKRRRKSRRFRQYQNSNRFWGDCPLLGRPNH